eukprot:4629825-Pyramimonas_sp.AAC.1
MAVASLLPSLRSLVRLLLRHNIKLASCQARGDQVQMQLATFQELGFHAERFCLLIAVALCLT